METSVYMCFPCYQEFSTLEEVLVHQLTCNPEAERKEEFLVVPPDAPAEQTLSEAVLPLCGPPVDEQQSEQQPQSQADSDSTGQIRYQCGDCGHLFDSLGLWQQHRKLGLCLAPESEPGTDGPEQNGVDPEQNPDGEGAVGEAGEAETVGGAGADADAAGVEGGGAEAGAGAETGGDAVAAGDAGGGAETGGGPGGGAETETEGGAEAAEDKSARTEGGGKELAVSQDHAYLQSARLGTERGTDGGAPVEGPGSGVTSTLAGASPPEPNGPRTAEVEDQSPSPKRRGHRKPKPPAPAATPMGLLCVDCGAAFTLVPELVAHRKAQHSLEGALHRCSICGESFLNTTLFLYHRKQHRKKEGEGPGQEASEVQGQVLEVQGQEPEMPGQVLEVQGQVLEVQGQVLEVQGQVLEVQGQVAEVQDSIDEAAEACVSEEQVVDDGQVVEETAVVESQNPQVSDAAEPDVKPPALPEEAPPPNFLCVDCGSGFSTEQTLAEHRRTAHGLQEALHRCPECGEGFMNTTLFLYHRRKHRAGEGAGSRAGPPQSPAGAACPSSTLALHANALKRKGSPGLSALCKKSRAENGEGEPTAIKAEPMSLDITPEPQPAHLSRNWSRTPLPHACPHCGRTFTRRCLLRAHVFTHTGEKLFNCKVCSKSFSRPSNLIRHSRAHAQGKPHPCDRCGKAFNQAETLRRHRAMHDQAGQALLPFACHTCPSSFHTRPELESHRLTHATRVFSCSECGQSFKRRKHLDQHTLMHQEKEPKTCPICSVQFLNQSVLDNHLQHCSGKEDRSQGRGRGQGRGRSMGQLECDMCGHCCVTQEGLELHRLSHTGQTPLRCPLAPCRRRFLSSAALEEHVLSHCQGGAAQGPARKPHPYRCDHCGKGFAYASTFNMHMRIHTGERPYECSHCGKRFRQLPHLQDHERIHSGARPFCCWLCGKSFSVAARLTEHARTHSGEKPYACDRCPRAFRSRSNLDKHARAHGDPPAARSAPAGPEGEAAVRTILLVQDPSSSATTAIYHTDPSSLLLLHPSVTMVTEQDIQQTIEVMLD